MLLERAERERLQDVPLSEALPVAGAVLRRLAVRVPSEARVAGAPLEWTTDWAAGHVRDLPGRWEQVGRPCPESVVERCVSLASGLAHDAPPVLVDADLHYENVHAGVREPWLALDPVAVTGDIEHQTAQLLWSRVDELPDAAAIRDALSVLIGAGHLDADRAHAWALVRTVDYWFWGLANGLTFDPPRCARIVAALTGA